MNAEKYECNQCGIVLMYRECPVCFKCGKAMTLCPSVNEIMLEMRYRRMVKNSPSPAAEAMAASIERVVKHER